MKTPSKNALPKLEDVAARAGVSAATVSRFYNNPQVVAPATAKRIRAAIEATGYVPNLIAGGLASNRSRLVAVLVPDVAQSIFNDTIEAMTSELARDGNTVMLGLTGADNAHMVGLIDAALSRRVEALILTGVVTDAATRRRLRQRGVTVIETWGIPDDPIDAVVGFSHLTAGREIAAFLLGRGYARPLLATAESPRARQRRDGFIQTWTAAGRKSPQVHALSFPTRLAHARAVWHYYSESAARPDVIVCSSDLLAQGVIIEALSAGLRVPHDVAVVGFGNLAISGDMRPSITTMDIDGARMGREAVDLLRRRAAGNLPPGTVIDVGHRLIARESA